MDLYNVCLLYVVQNGRNIRTTKVPIIQLPIRWSVFYDMPFYDVNMADRRAVVQEKIKTQGEIVRKLKSESAEKDKVNRIKYVTSL